MKLLFSSPDLPRLERLSKKLTACGIACEVRQTLPAPPVTSALGFCPELWLKEEEDLRTAAMLLASDLSTS